MTKLHNKVVFITGGSRGIGLAIAKRFAKDGAKIAIVAKTAEPHPKLPGTIYTAATEIETIGGQALALQADIRDENQVADAVEKTVQTFGGIDILVNNASAINLTGTLQTPMKRYDLMHGVNVRGTYCTSQACLPHLFKADNPHILNISPPLNMEARWFSNHVAYTMAKYGMSLCVLGMAEEFADANVAVNALWPKTVIDTAALAMFGGMVKPEYCRKPSIVADAAYAIVSRPAAECTGQFFVDEEVLKRAGVTNFDQYAHTSGNPLLPDYFL